MSAPVGIHPGSYAETRKPDSNGQLICWIGVPLKCRLAALSDSTGDSWGYLVREALAAYLTAAEHDAAVKKESEE